MSFFRVGERYRDSYLIEHVVPFFDGELAIAQVDSKRYYLQSANLLKQTPSRAIQQYRAFVHPLVVPFEEVYTEERLLIYIRPYYSITPLREVISTREVDEDQVVAWGKQLLHLEAELKSKPIPMYLLLDSRNIGISDDGELKVLFCGLEQITALQPTLDWGTFFYSLLSGEYLEAPIEKLPDDFPVSKSMARLIQKSLGNRSIDSIYSLIDSYEKKTKGEGLLRRLFFKQKKSNEDVYVKSNTNFISPATVEGASSTKIQSVSESSDLSPKVANELDKEQMNPTTPPKEQQDEIEESGQKRLEQMRLEFEQREKELRQIIERRYQELIEPLEKLRQEFERRQQELLEQQAQELELQQQKLLEEMRKEERKHQGRSRSSESPKVVVDDDVKQHKNLLSSPPARSESLLHPSQLEREKLDPERLQKENEERQRLQKERLEREIEEHNQLAKQFEEYMKQMLHPPYSS